MRKYLLLFIAVLNMGLYRVRAESPADYIQDSIPQKMSVVDYHFKPVHLILPTALIGAGILGTTVDGMNDFHLFSRSDSVKTIKIDNYLEWGMLGWVFLCDLMGEEKHNWADQLFLVCIAEGINAGMVQGIKRTVDTRRPDGQVRSFPSGHTANAFLGAHIAYKEFRETQPVIAYSGYAMATLVAISRLYNNRHWVADVVAGAGFGILSVELSYLIYFPIRNAIARNVNKKAVNGLVVAPMMSSQGGGFYLSFTF